MRHHPHVRFVLLPDRPAHSTPHQFPPAILLPPILVIGDPHRRWLIPLENSSSSPRNATLGCLFLLSGPSAIDDHCNRYYDQNADAGRLVSQTMSTVPDTQRAPFIKLQASIRSAYHADVNARRHAELKAHLSSISPGGSLTPLARADPRGPVAARERHNRLESFVETWCAQSLPGPRPFFEGLWCLMRLQTLPAKIGGAGSHRLEWEIDDALFRETAWVDVVFIQLD